MYAFSVLNLQSIMAIMEQIIYPLALPIVDYYDLSVALESYRNYTAAHYIVNISVSHLPAA